MAKKQQYNKYDLRHWRNLKKYEHQLDAIYREAIREAVAISGTIGGIDTDKIFSFDDYPATRKRVDSLLADMQSQVEAVVLNGIDAEWTLANNKNSELANLVFGDAVGKLTQAQYRRYYSTNDSARRAFAARRVDGLNLSQRVWNLAGQFKSELELGLDVGIRNGRSADDLSRDIRQYLKRPDMLFRRVKDEHGNLQLSKRAAAYHPGRGVYRSSYKNARRLAATETNIAYRTADHLRWQQMDFVVGIEIRTSPTNHPVPDICDDLKGKYPKDFKFTGWHPHCRCHAISILKTEEEMDADTQRILNGEQPSDPNSSVNAVTDVPKKFKDWVDKNLTRIVKAKQLPYFITDNADIVINMQTAKSPSTVIAKMMETEHFLSYAPMYKNRSELYNTLLEQYNSAPTDIGKAIALNQLKREAANFTLQDLQAWGMIDDSFTWARTEFDAVVQKHYLYQDKAGNFKVIPEKKMDLMIFKDKNGLEFAYPVGIIKGNAFSAIEASEAIGEFPPYLKRGIKRVSFIGQPCPMNPYWRVAYDDPNFVAMATDGGSTHFWMCPNSKEDFKGYMAHEAGHIIDGEKYRYSSSKAWQEAVAKDDEFYRQHKVKSNRVSKYAETNDYEDFAECMKAYITDHEFFKSLFPNRAAFIRQMAQRLSGHFPKRP